MSLFHTHSDVFSRNLSMILYVMSISLPSMLLRHQDPIVLLWKMHSMATLIPGLPVGGSESVNLLMPPVSIGKVLSSGQASDGRDWHG